MLKARSAGHLVGLSLAVAVAAGVPRAGAADQFSPAQTSAVPVPDGQIDGAVAELDRLAQELMTRTRIPGLAVAVVRDGRTVYAKGFGVRKVGEPASVDADTVFQIASVSKAVTGTVVARQVGIGAATWDMPIRRQLPWFRLRDPWVSDHVTVADLLAHRSGLPDHAGDALEDIGFSQRQVLERLRLLPLAPFRASYAYTNFGFTAGALAVAAAAGKDWPTLAQDALYAPLGMTATSSRFADFEGRPNRAVGHVRNGERWEARHQRQPDAQSPAGGVSSSVNDLARWMAMVLQNGRFEGKEIIAPKALLAAVSGQVISSPASAPDARTGLYGFGFNVGTSASGRVVINHSGGFASGAGTYVAMIPSLGVGIVVLTNAEPIGVAETLGTEFNDLVQFGKIERDWYAGYHALMAPLTAPVGTLVGQTRPANPTPPASPRRYLGRYDSAFYGPLEVGERDGGLVIRLGPARVEYALQPWDGNSFTFIPSSENQPAGSVGRASFAGGNRTGFRTVTIDYLDEGGMGTFSRR